MQVAFGELAIGDRFRLEGFFGVKQEPRVCEDSRRFYRGECRGYPCKSPFYDWNARYQWMGHGEWHELSLAPETMVERLA